MFSISEQQKAEIEQTEAFIERICNEVGNNNTWDEMEDSSPPACEHHTVWMNWPGRSVGIATNLKKRVLFVGRMSQREIPLDEPGLFEKAMEAVKWAQASKPGQVQQDERTQAEADGESLEDQADDLDEAIAAHKYGLVLLTIANALRGFGMGLENATPKGYMPRGFTLGTRRCDNWFTIHADAETDLIEIAVETGWPVPFLEFLEDREGYFKGSKVEDGSGPGRRLVRFWLPLDCPDLISLIDVFIESDMDK